MKTIYLTKGPPVPGTNGGRHWLVTDAITTTSLEIADDIDAPIGSIWDGDYRSGRPTFNDPYRPGIGKSEAPDKAQRRRKAK